MRNTAYWGGAPALDTVHLIYYNDTASQIQALQAGELDLIDQFSYQEGQGLIKSGQFQIFSSKSSVHRELAMRVDVPPFNDKNARVALALAINRPAILQTLFGGQGVLGNDSPIAPSQAAFPKNVPQRKMDRQGQAARRRARSSRRSSRRRTRTSSPTLRC